MPVPGWIASAPQVRHIHHREARPGRLTDFPDWVPEDVKLVLGQAGITRLWEHQRRAADAAFGGQHVAISTGTASGKTLAYLVPIMASSQAKLGMQPPATAIYLSPTKALAHDQHLLCRSLDFQDWRVTTLDGDSDTGERRYAREFATYVLTNPDMLHRSLLPNHLQWTRLLRNLRYVVVDEAHRYRGVFGAHVASVLRRLRRLARHYGANPTFICASATMSEADAFAALLTGADDFELVDEDTASRPSLDYVLWQPARDPHHEAAELLAGLVNDGSQTLAFTTSRVQAELVALRAQESAVGHRLAAYRAGYLADDRRAIETGLKSGLIRGVACTNALELGVDIAGVDAVISCGFPGTLAALWQQAGRAGRAGRDALAILVARDDPLDAYLCEHPDLIFNTPIERLVLFPENPLVLARHVAAAAQELPVTLADVAFFGDTLGAMLDLLEGQGALRKRSAGWYWTHPSRAVDSIDLRSASGKAVDVIDAATGQLVGNADPATADRSLYPGAVYLHQGEQWLVDEVNDVDRVAMVRRAQLPYFTQALSVSDIRIISTEQSRRLPHADAFFGRIEMTSQVVGYLRRDEETGEVWDQTPLESPTRALITQAVWWTVTDATLQGLDLPDGDLAGAAHAAEHTAIGLLPAFAPCDRWDIGGLSTVRHPDTGLLTVFVVDGHPGGAGFAERGYERITEWLSATLDRLRSCDCSDGCPRCVVSPKCGNGNNPLSKSGAIALLGAITA